MALKKNESIEGTPDAEIQIDQELILRLLLEQHPDLAALPIRLFDSGWDNMIFRLGNELCVRIPRRHIAAELIENEQRWLPRLAKNLPLPVTAPVRIGSPTAYYPWHWSVLPWIEGQSADRALLIPSQAKVLGKFLKALHIEAPVDFPKNPYRGQPISEKKQPILERIDRLQTHLGAKAHLLSQKWEQAVSAIDDTPPRILHGDLHPQNILSKKGMIVGIIDWGDMTSGDIAADLASAWMLFSTSRQREDFFTAYGTISKQTLSRAEGWAISFGTMFFEKGMVNNERQEVLGRKILQNITS